MKSRKELRLCTTVVRAELKSSEDRIAAAKALIDAPPNGSQLIVLPAGFLRAPNEEVALQAAQDLVEVARKKRVAVIVGVHGGKQGSVKHGTLQSYLMCWAPGMSRPCTWRQRSETSADAGDAPPELFVETRLLNVAGRNVAPIACGEVFSPIVREDVAKLKPHVAVLAAHQASGARHWAAQRCLAKRSSACARCARCTRAAELAIFCARPSASGRRSPSRKGRASP